jgi:hypothetical protein
MNLPVLKSAFLAVALAAANFVASAQTVTMKDFLTKPEVPLTCMGVDFSGAKYYGDPGTVSPQEMKSLFTRIDDLLVNESDKYDLAKAFKREKVNYAISIAESVNQKIDPGTIISTTDAGPTGRFTPAIVERMVGHYTYPSGASGVGVVFVVEDIMKTKEKEIIWVTFVDLASKKMLYTEKMSATGAGFGFRNHWAAPIYSVIKDIKSSMYGEWKKKFAKS